MSTTAHDRIDVPWLGIASKVERTDYATWSVAGETYSSDLAARAAAEAAILGEMASYVEHLLEKGEPLSFGYPYGIADEAAAVAFVSAAREQAVSAAMRAAHGLR